MSNPRPSRPSADRNLLFGILALQMDFINRDALIAAMNAWVLDKDKPLGQLLVEQRALAPRRLALLDSLVEEHLDEHGRDPEKSLAAVGSAGIARARLNQIADPDVKASLARVLVEPASSGDTVPEGTVVYQPAKSSCTRFVILRPHAKGGLGEVFVALDEELNREVALKAILERNAHDAVSRARFVQEAEITGRLEHPGIVPVYGYGEHQDGRPYYAMRFIKGDSLREAIKHFHDTKQAADGPPALALRKLLGAFLAVCQAIHYAHSRGILHRDLKPDNIMLGKFGETLVVDWGLAKPINQMESEADESERSLGEAPLRPFSGSGSVETQAGTAIGTPGYMSPEQASGRHDLMGPASDVYGLGATLYCLLTGKAPFAGGDKGDVLQRVQRGDFPPPRAVDTGISASLEAICLKAMALAPKERYASALDLAEDLEHWLADEPVRAYPEPRRARLARWGRRHKPLMAGAAALLLTAVVALSLGLLLLGQANTEIQGQRDQAEKNFDEAQRQHDQAVAHLYRSLVGEARAIRGARGSGYRTEAWKRLEEALRLETPEKDITQLRQEAAACLGDFVGLEPSVWDCPAGWRILALDLHPAGELLAVVLYSRATSGSELRIRNLATGQEVARLRAGRAPLVSVTFSPDGRKLFAGDTRGTVQAWEVNAGGLWVGTKALAAQPQFGSFVTPSPIFPFFVARWGLPLIRRLAISPDGKYLAATGFWTDSVLVVPTVCVWDLADGHPASAFVAPDVRSSRGSGWTGAAFSPRGDLFVATYEGDKSNGVYVWDVATRQLKQTLRPDLGDVHNICFSADGKYLACACLGGVALFDTEAFQRRLFVRGDYSMTVAFSPDSRLLAIPTIQSGLVRLWNITTNRDVAVLGHPGGNDFVSFSADGKRLVVAGDSVHVWNLAGAAEKRTLAGHSGGVPGLAFSPDGKLLASTGKDRTVRLWGPVTGQLVRELRGFGGPAQSVAYSADGRFLTTTSGAVKVWEVPSGQEVATVPRDLGRVGAGAGFSPDGKWFMTCSGLGVRIWSVLHAGPGEDGRPRLTFQEAPSPKPGEANSACFSPDSKLLAWVALGPSTGPRLAVWDLATAQQRSWPATVFQYLALSFLPDSKHLVLVNHQKGQVEVWDATTGEVTAAFGKKELLAGETVHTALSADGAWLAVGGTKSVTVWDMTRRELLLALPEERGTIWSLAWGPNKDLLAVGSSDGGLVIWNFPRIKAELTRIGLSW
ncbi:MAG: protein kinase [Planctomycetes bacterium]|nr:protein kinase [Planctomycetota bacterium]